MKRAALLLCLPYVAVAQLLISEVMFNPQGSEHQNEFIEIYNSGAEVIQIKGWCLSDGVGVDTLMAYPGVTGIQPGGYGLILDPDYDWALGPYLDLIPDDPALFSISTDQTFGSAGLRNGGESVILWPPDSAFSLGMEWIESSTNGYSLEREILDESIPALWLESLTENGTPGYRNSVTPPDRNVSLDSLWIETTIPNQDELLHIGLLVSNTGLLPVVNLLARIEIHRSGSLVSRSDGEVLSLEPGEVRQIEFLETIPAAGWLALSVFLANANDELPEDDSLSLRFFAGATGRMFEFSEIMPVPEAGEKEWIELVNLATETQDFFGWSVQDASGQTAIVDSHLTVGSRAYLLLSEAPLSASCGGPSVQLNLPSLNNGDELLYLIDPLGQHQDSLRYSLSDHPVGRSLERMQWSTPAADGSNWSSSVHIHGHTAGCENSLHHTSISKQLAITLEPNPFTPNGDGRQDELFIHYSLPWSRGLLSVTVYDLAGRPVSQISTQRPVAHKGNLAWDGSWKYSDSPRVGLYLMHIVAESPEEQTVLETVEKAYVARVR